MKGGAAMAALTSQSLTLAGVVPSPVVVAASDTIAASQFGSIGVLVRVINAGGSPDTVAIVDPNTTIVGSVATNPTVVVSNGTTKVFFVPVAMINQATQLATLTHTFITSVTCEVFKV